MPHTNSIKSTSFQTLSLIIVLVLQFFLTGKLPQVRLIAAEEYNSSSSVSNCDDQSCCLLEEKNCDQLECNNDICEIRSQDEIWIISTRCLGCPEEENKTPDFAIWKYAAPDEWKKSSLKEFLKSSDQKMPTRFWVHGNRIDQGTAIDVGWMAYRCIVGCLPKNQPVRVVFWSWPSDKTRGQIRDIRAKRYRADLDAYYLAWLINKISPQQPIGILGYSYGSLVGSGAMHLLGGGELDERAISQLSKQKRRPLQNIFMASAIGADWMLPGGEHEMSLQQSEGLLHIYNSLDPALKRFHIVTQCRGEQAVGYTGLDTSWLADEDAKKVKQYDVRCIIGRKHDYLLYFGSPTVCEVCSQYFMQQTQKPIAKKSIK